MREIARAKLARRLERGIELDCGRGLACRVLLPSPGLVRVVFIPASGFREGRSWMVSLGADDVPWEGRDRLDVADGAPVPFEVATAEDRVTLTSEGLSIEIGLAALSIRWRRPDGAVFASDRTSRAYAFGRHQPRLLHAMARHPDDRYYGLGDKTGALDLRGRRLRTVMTDALGFDPATGDPLYKHWPFLIVRDGETGTFYGILYDNLVAATFDLGCEHSNYYGLYRSYEAEDGDLDYTLIAGPSLVEVIAGFARLTGRMAFGPRWSLGFAQTAMALADAPDAQERIAGFVDRCAGEAVPISSFHFGSGYTMIGRRRYVFNWNRQKFPEPQRLMAKFKAAGMHVVANLKPCLLEDHPRFSEATKAGALIADATTGKPATSQFWDGEGAHLDFTGRAGIEWWQRGLREQILAMGIDSAWNDNNEYELWNEDARCEAFGHAAPLELVRPAQALLMTRASIEEQARIKPAERPFTVTRAGCPGIQRYAQTWSGDNSTSWASLRWNLRTGLQMSLSGMFNIGHDVGGFSGPVPSPELLVRFTQSGLLHPRFIMNSWKADGTVTTPWLHAESLPAIRWAIRLRYRLMPYLYSLYRRAFETSEPIIRPTFFDFGSDSATFADSDELMLGPNLLGAPVVEEGARERRVYLPRGPTGWYDFASEAWYRSGETVTLAAPLERLPLLVPEGAILPLTAEPVDFSRLHDEPSRCMRIFPAKGAGHSQFTLYEDDGIGLGYRDGDFARLTFDLQSDAQAIRLRLKKEGGYRLPYDRISIAVPAGERRRVLLDAGVGAPQLVTGQFAMHAL
ncbi:MAG TPA: glycoside hydrolase family 31 protein [Stellaceae bacterium]|nr:glycoside hydrolase family 31 protein [Stellaceae bacterium]